MGGNGAGKSTCYRHALAPLGLPFVNADRLARIVFAEAPEAHSDEAAQLAERLCHQLLQQGLSFYFETVYSHPSKIYFATCVPGVNYIGGRFASINCYQERLSLGNTAVSSPRAGA